ncbi:MAG: EutN/CcmL family microcompartment protein [Planctomycetota bacterium]
MFLGRVVGRVVCTVKADGLQGVKLLVVQPIDEDGGDAGARVITADIARSGLGDRVVVVQGRESALALEPAFVPTDATIVGHVEQVEPGTAPSPRRSA